MSSSSRRRSMPSVSSSPSPPPPSALTSIAERCISRVTELQQHVDSVEDRLKSLAQAVQFLHATHRENSATDRDPDTGRLRSAYEEDRLACLVDDRMEAFMNNSSCSGNSGGVNLQSLIDSSVARSLASITTRLDKLESGEGASSSAARLSLDPNGDFPSSALKGALSRQIREETSEIRRAVASMAERNSLIQQNFEKESSHLVGEMREFQQALPKFVDDAAATTVSGLRERLENASAAEKQVASLTDRVWSVEQVCTRMCDDMTRRMQAQKHKLFEQLEGVHSDLQAELKGSATALHRFQKAMRDEFKRREKTLAALMQRSEQQIAKLASVVKAKNPESATIKGEILQSVQAALGLLKSEMLAELNRASDSADTKLRSFERTLALQQDLIHTSNAQGISSENYAAAANRQNETKEETSDRIMHLEFALKKLSNLVKTVADGDMAPQRDIDVSRKQRHPALKMRPLSEVRVKPKSMLSSRTRHYSARAETGATRLDSNTISGERQRSGDVRLPRRRKSKKKKSVGTLGEGG